MTLAIEQIRGWLMPGVVIATSSPPPDVLQELERQLKAAHDRETGRQADAQAGMIPLGGGNPLPGRTLAPFPARALAHR